MREFEELQTRLASLFGRPLPGNGEGERNSITLADWTPLVDVSEDGKEYLIKADLPGVKKEDVKVSIDNGVLTLSGERRSEKEEKGQKFHRIEKSYGSFQRSFTLPEGTDDAKIVAEFKDGVLNVRLPKSETAKSKSVAVKVE